MHPLPAAAGSFASRLARTAVLFCAAAALAACMPLLSERPAGDTPHQLDRSWEGTWVPQTAGEGPTYAVSLRVKDAAQGELEAAWLEQDGSGFSVRRETLWLRRAGPVLLATLPYAAFFKRGSADGRPPLYMWARIERTGADRLSISAPNFEAFNPYLGADLRFVGKNSNDKDAAIVPHVSGELLGRLKAGDQAWAQPVIYRKLRTPEAYPLPGP